MTMMMKVLIMMNGSNMMKKFGSMFTVEDDHNDDDDDDTHSQHILTHVARCDFCDGWTEDREEGGRRSILGS